MAGTLSALDSLLQNVYLPGLPSWVNNRRPLSGRIEKITDKKRFKGRQFIFAAKDANEQGVGAIAEAEILPQGVDLSAQNMTLAMKYYYGVTRVSAQAVSFGSGDGAFSDVVTTKLDSLRDQLEESMAIDLTYGDGSGAIGQVNTYATTVLTMIDQPTVGGNGTRTLRKGMLLSSYAAKSGGSANADAKAVSNIPSTTTATVPSSAGFVANDYVFRAVTAGTDPRNKQMMGLGGVVDDGSRVSTFQNISRSSVAALKANKLGNSGTLRAWSPELMDQGAMEAALNGGGGSPTAMYSPLEIQRRAAAFLRSDQRYDMKVHDLEGGYKGITWYTPDGSVPWFWDRFCIPNEVHFVRESDLFMAIDEDIQPEKRDGGMWRATDRTHQFECWLYTWRNLGARACNSHTLVGDISHTL